MGKSLNKVVLFGYSENVGLTYHLAHLAIAMKNIYENVIVVNNGLEQSEGLISKLNERKIKIINNKCDEISRHCDSNTIIHCHGVHQLKLVEMVAVKNRAKVVFTLHAYRNSSRYKKIVILYLMLRFRFVSKWVFQTYFSYLDFKECGFKKSFDIIPLGMEKPNEIKKELFFYDVKMEKKLPYEQDVKYIFYGAQFYSHKRHDSLIRNLSSILNGDKNIKLMLCGDGPELENTFNMAERIGISERVHFLGRVDRNVYLKHLKNSSLSIVTSRTETFGHNILEPLMLGIPVVSTLVGIAPKVISDYVNGFLVDIDDTEKLLFSVDYICNNNMEFDFESLVSEYSWENCAKRYMLSYSSLFGRGDVSI